jgi:hypothetical protein
MTAARSTSRAVVAATPVPESLSRRVGASTPARPPWAPQPPHRTAATATKLAGPTTTVLPSGADVRGEGRPHPPPGAEAARRVGAAGGILPTRGEQAAA